ncbi:MAG: DnaB-like helicase C-terminal domain-containing protein, partial [Verrucomicrobiota bacterium]
MMKGDDDLLSEMLGREEEGQACSSREESRPEDAGLEAIDPPILPTMREGMLEAVQEIEELVTQGHSSKGTSVGVPTGFRDLDGMTGGWQPGELIVLGARPSMGKTSLALGMVAHAVGPGKVPTAVFSLEVNRRYLSQRMLCSEAGIPLHRIRGGFLSERRDFPRLARAASVMAEYDLWIDDTTPLTGEALRERARRYRKEKSIGLILIDHLHLVRPACRLSREDREEDLGEIVVG